MRMRKLLVLKEPHALQLLIWLGCLVRASVAIDNLTSSVLAIAAVRVDPLVVGKAILILVCGLGVARIKKRLLGQLVKLKKQDVGHHDDDDSKLRKGRLSFYNQFINILIASVVSTFLLGLFQTDMGPGIQSIFAAGGIGALIFGMASKDLAEQIVGGLVINTWDVINEGDEVHLHKCGISGVVQHIGLTDTDIRGYDNIVIKIPNSHIFNQRVSNISRITMAQIKLLLRFPLSNVLQLPATLKEIKAEISSCCAPTVIVDGSKPFRAHIYEFMPDHVQVIINVHVRTRPGSQAYYDIRQDVLLAIAAAVERSGTQFAIPAVAHVSMEGNNNNKNKAGADVQSLEDRKEDAVPSGSKA